MTARSVVLSVLLGAPGTAAELLRLTADFGIREPTLRVAVTRWSAPGIWCAPMTATDSPIACWPANAARTGHCIPMPGTGTAPGSPRSSPRWELTPEPVRRCERHCCTTGSVNSAKGCGCDRTIWIATCPNRPGIGFGYCGPVTTIRSGWPGNSGICPPGRRPGTGCCGGWTPPMPSRTVRRRGGDGPPSAHRPGAAPGLLPADWPGDALRAAYADFADLLTSRRDGVIVDSACRS